MPTGVPASGRRKRRGKKTAEAIRAVLGKIRNGTPVVFAVVAGGVCKQTWHRWVSEDPKLKADVEEAVAFAVDEAFDYIRQSDSWQARAWYLERCHGFVATVDVRTTLGVDGYEDVEFKVEFDDGVPMPIADADDEAAVA